MRVRKNKTKENETQENQKKIEEKQKNKIPSLKIKKSYLKNKKVFKLVSEKKFCWKLQTQNRNFSFFNLGKLFFDFSFSK